MNRNAQNALLKILEEPPKQSILILVCHRLGAMIPTIRSRCRVLHFNPLDETSLKRLMEKEVGESLSAKEQKLLAAMANGSIGIAQKIIETGGLETAQTVLNIFEKWPNFNQVQIHHLADTAGRPGQDGYFNNIERIFLLIAEQFAFAKAKSLSSLEPPFDMPVFTKMVNDYSLEYWLTKYEELRDHFAQAKFANLDKRLAVISAFNLIRP
jgi:DNA polymerase-3 subunit delta'